MKTPFNELTKTEKKIAVAKDIINAVKKGLYVPTEGEYVIFRNLNVDMDADLKENYKKIETCEVCQMGATLVSITKFANKLTFDEVEGLGTMSDETDSEVKQLLKVFTKKELTMMELSLIHI